MGFFWVTTIQEFENIGKLQAVRCEQMKAPEAVDLSYTKMGILYQAVKQKSHPAEDLHDTTEL